MYTVGYYALLYFMINRQKTMGLHVAHAVAELVKISSLSPLL